MPHTPTPPPSPPTTTPTTLRSSSCRASTANASHWLGDTRDFCRGDGGGGNSERYGNGHGKWFSCHASSVESRKCTACVSAAIPVLARSPTPEAEQNNASATEEPTCALLDPALSGPRPTDHTAPHHMLYSFQPVTAPSSALASLLSSAGPPPPPAPFPSPQRPRWLTIAACTSGALTALKRALNTCWDPPPPRRMAGTTFSITCRHKHMLHVLSVARASTAHVCV